MENTSTNTELAVIMFPNRNATISPNVIDYAKRYKHFLNKTAEAILSLTETVYEAKHKLKDTEFKQFQEEVGLKSKATLSKFIAIGEKVDRLKPYKKTLPHSWTTIYKLVRLEESEFDEIKEFLFSEMTASDVDELLGNAPHKIKYLDKPDIKLYLQMLTHNEKLQFAAKLHRILKQYKIHHCMPTALSEDNCSNVIIDI